MAGYYRRFVKDFAKIANPLHMLLQKDVKFKWGDAQENAFQTLKHALLSPPILAFPNFDKPFILYTDASTEAIGYLLGQKDDQNREVVIAYGGRALTSSEKKLWYFRT